MPAAAALAPCVMLHCDARATINHSHHIACEQQMYVWLCVPANKKLHRIIIILVDAACSKHICMHNMMCVL